MPNSLRTRIKKLAYQGVISDKDKDRIVNALDMAEQKVDNDCISKAELLKHTRIEYDDDGVGHKVVYVEDVERLASANYQKPHPTTTQQITESNQQITKSLQDSLKAGGSNATMLNYELSAIDRRLADISVTLAMIADRLGGESE